MRTVRVDVQDGRLAITWEYCGHTVLVDGPHVGHWLAVGNGDPCPICEGGDMPRESIYKVVLE